MSSLLSGLRACVRKELLLLSRDLHGLSLLFIMPLAFILIMSLALQNQFAERTGSKLHVMIVDRDQSTASRVFLDALRQDEAFAIAMPGAAPAQMQVDERLRRGDYAFAVTIPKGYSVDIASLPAAPDESSRRPLVEVSVAPDSSRQIEAIFVGSVTAVLGRERLRRVANGLGYSLDLGDAVQGAVAVRYAYSSEGRMAAPTAVQQNVPAWLVFAAFFIVVPLSNTLIRERQQGTLRRLRSTKLSALTVLLGKLIPYFAVNQLQVLLMLLAGRYLVPALGGESLQISGSLALLATMSASLSVAALGLALLIAVSSRTTEQATLMGGTVNIVLAAIGGIMIPKFLMPPAMQAIARWSPMSWGLEGFLDVLLRDAGLSDIAPKAVGLTLLGTAAILLAWLIQSRRTAE